jgi:hypothetical protein
MSPLFATHRSLLSLEQTGGPLHGLPSQFTHTGRLERATRPAIANIEILQYSRGHSSHLAGEGPIRNWTGVEWTHMCVNRRRQGVVRPTSVARLGSLGSEVTHHPQSSWPTPAASLPRTHPRRSGASIMSLPNRRDASAGMKSISSLRQTRPGLS